MPSGTHGEKAIDPNSSDTKPKDSNGSATGGANSFTYGGTVSDNGKSFTIKLSVSTSGNGQGTIQISGQPVKIIKVGDTAYFSSTKKFWDQTAGAGAGSLFGTRWVTIPSSDSNFASFASLLDANQVAGQFSGTSGTTLTKGKTSTINGQPVIAVTGKGSTGGGTVYVATTGKPYLIRVTTTGTSLTFSNYNKPVNPKAPPTPSTSAQPAVSRRPPVDLWPARSVIVNRAGRSGRSPGSRWQPMARTISVPRSRDGESGDHVECRKTRDFRAWEAQVADLG